LGVTSVGSDLVASEWAGAGPWIDFVGPGEGVVSTFADPSNSPTPVENYATWSGTSAAAGFVTGYAALVMSLRPDLSLMEVAAAMAQGSVPLDQLNPANVGNLGAGIPAVYDSLNWLAEGGEPLLANGPANPLGACK
jgi:subtilisin family serine protease